MNLKFDFWKNKANKFVKRNNLKYKLPYIISKSTAIKSSLSLIDQSVFSVTNFVRNIIVARILSKESYGLFILLFSVLMLLTDVQSTLISTPYTIYSPRLNTEEISKYTGSSIIHQFFFSVFSVTLFIFAGFTIHFGLDQKMVSHIFWSIFFVIPLVLIRDHLRRICFAQLKITKALVIDTIVFFVQILGLLLLVQFHFVSIQHVFWIMGLSCLLSSSYWFLRSYSAFSISFGRITKDFKKNWKIGKWAFASGVLWSLKVNLYPWILAYVHGIESSGVWGACIGAVAVANPLILGIQNIILPKTAYVYAKNGPFVLRRFIIKSSIIYTTVITPFCFLIILFADEILTILYGKKYAGNGIVVLFLAINLIILVFEFTFSRGLFTFERADIDFKINIIPIIFLFFPGLWFIKVYGVTGAATTLVLGNLIAAVIRYFSISNYINSLRNNIYVK